MGYNQLKQHEGCEVLTPIAKKKRGIPMTQYEYVIGSCSIREIEPTATWSWFLPTSSVLAEDGHPEVPGGLGGWFQGSRNRVVSPATCVIKGSSEARTVNIPKVQASGGRVKLRELLVSKAGCVGCISQKFANKLCKQDWWPGNMVFPCHWACNLVGRIGNATPPPHACHRRRHARHLHDPLWVIADVGIWAGKWSC